MPGASEVPISSEAHGEPSDGGGEKEEPEPQDPGAIDGDHWGEENRVVVIDDDESCGCDAFEENDDSDDAGGGAGEEQRGRGGEAEKRGA